MLSRPRVISLKWKTLALLGVALAVVNFSLILYSYQDHIDSFHEQRGQALERQLSTLQQLLKRSDERMQRIGVIIPNVVNSVGSGPELVQQWLTLQLELNLYALELRNAQGEVLLRGLDGENPRPAAVQERVLAALGRDEPDRFLLCQQTCIQYALVPAVGNDGEQRLLVLAADLADVVLQFPGLTGADIALFANTDDHGDWSAQRPVAVSNAPQNQRVLGLVAERFSFADLAQGQNTLIDDRSYRISARQWSEFGGLGAGHVLIFEDISTALGAIISEVRKGLVTGVLALLLATLLGLLILNRPMNQLRRLAEALPMLAEKDYAPARQLIGNDHQHSRYPTEIEELEGLTVALADRLEELEKLVEARNQAIAEKVSELRRSQDLNEKIFATAPIAMLMLSSDGLIVRVNEFTCTLLGYSDTELRDRSFLSLLADARQSREAGNALIDLIAGRRAIYEQSGSVSCINGDQERMTWMHSRVLAQGGVFILALGLPDRSTAGDMAVQP